MARCVYSYHKSREAALAALEGYYAIGELFDCDDADVVRVAGGRWAVEIRDGLYSY